MIKPAPTIDLRGQLVFLGTGTSVGVPCIGCGCEVCQSDDPRNQRLRCSVALGLPGGTLLIDTSPDMRTQVLRAKLPPVQATLYTHDHVDHLYGLDDLRMYAYMLGKPMPVYCEPQVEARIRRAFDYAFTEEAKNYAGGVPQLDIHSISTEPFEVLGATIRPLRLHHGRFRVLGFRIGNVAYCTDTSEIPEESWSTLAGLDVLILDALRHRPHVSHFSVDEAVAVAQKLGAKRTLLTHMSHDLDHEETRGSLPPGIEPAYDGLRIPLT